MQPQFESGGDGTDTVLSSINFSLSNAARVGGVVENLTLSGTAAINGTGTTLANTITGNLGANILNGLAGNDLLQGLDGNDMLIGEAGNDALIGGVGQDKLYGNAGTDSLTGGAGVDHFIFNTTPNATTNRDRVADFVHGGDKFWMENAVFTKLGAAGALNPAFFRLGAAAADANDYLVYDFATGNLFYDGNGSAAGGAVQFAMLTTKPILSAGILSWSRAQELRGAARLAHTSRSKRFHCATEAAIAAAPAQSRGYRNHCN